jgi:putative ABC transport system permease protein
MGRLNRNERKVNPEGMQAKTRELRGSGILARTVCLLWMCGQGMRIHGFQLCLTLLTMAVGSFALSLTYFLGEGALTYLWQDMEQLMGTSVLVFPEVSQGSQILKKRPIPDLTFKDLEFVRKNVKDVRLIEPFYQGIKPVRYRNITRTMGVDGVNSQLSHEPIFTPISGQGFSRAGQEGLVWECLLTETAARLFETTTQSNPFIDIDGRPFQLMGVTPDPPGAEGLFRARIIIPYRCAQVLWLPPGSMGEIWVAWSNLDKMGEVIGNLRAALDKCRGPDAYSLTSSQFKIQKSRSIISNFITYGQTQGLFCIAVAFVGVINVMLTNIARRSLEFAIRITMGARHYEILVSVLMESSLLSIAGAIIGVVLSVCAAPYAAHLMQSRIQGTNELVPYYSLKGILYPVIICGVAGLIAGVIPALKARRPDVLSVLRNDA